jgi:hypothetical protein
MSTRKEWASKDAIMQEVADVPENWEDIAAYLNGIIDEQGIDDANELWESFWNGQLDKTPADFGL